MASLDEYTREQAILAGLRAGGTVAVAELAEQLGVSTVTIRKDLSALERRSLLRRVRGGAVSRPGGDEGAFELRLGRAREAKRAVARAAAATVADGDVIAVDSSTTAFHLVHEILDRRDLVVVTNGLRVALLLMERSGARVLMPGGVLRRSAGSLVGAVGDGLRGRGRITKGFFGLVGLSAAHGLMDLSEEEAGAKRALASACDQVYGLFDSSKTDGFGLHPFVGTDRVAGLYTDQAAAPEFVRAWRALGVPLTLVPADPPPGGARPAPTGAPARPAGRTKEI